MIKKIIFLFFVTFSSIYAASNMQDMKLEQFIQKLKKLSEQKEKNNLYNLKEVNNKKQTIQEKIRQEQILNQYIEMKQKYDPLIISEKIDIYIKTLQSMIKHENFFDNIYVPYYNSYNIDNKKYVYVKKDDLDKIVNDYKYIYKKKGIINNLIDRLKALKEGIKNNKSLLINKDLQFIITQIDDIYQNNKMLINSRQNNQIIKNENKDLVKLYIGQTISDGLKIKKIVDNTILIGY